MCAVSNGHGDVVKLLLEKGARVDLTSENNVTALALADKDGRTEIAAALKQAGAQK